MFKKSLIIVSALFVLVTMLSCLRACGYPHRRPGCDRSAYSRSAYRN